MNLTYSKAQQVKSVTYNQVGKQCDQMAKLFLQYLAFYN